MTQHSHGGRQAAGGGGPSSGRLYPPSDASLSSSSESPWDDGVFLIDGEGTVLPLRQPSGVWRTPRQGRTVPFNQRFSQMWRVPRTLLKRLSFESRLRKALREEELVVHLQPKATVDSSRIVGAEALVRWVQPGKATVMPEDFVPFAEDNDLISALDEQVLRRVCAYLRRRADAALEQVPVSVNVSVKHLERPHFVETLAVVIEEAEVDPNCIELEITESAQMENVKTAGFTLHRLRQMGIRIALDDFGVGYFSFAQLRYLPVQALKIDRELIRDVDIDPMAGAVVRSIIAMAKSLELEVVAEGVETCEQLDFLKEAGCPTFQGYLLTGPLPMERFDAVSRQQAKLLASERGRNDGPRAAA